MAEPQVRDAPVVLSIDVEDYYQVAAFRNVVRRSSWPSFPSRVEANVSRLLDLLSAFGVSATWFVLGWEAEKRPGMVRSIDAAGHEIACHSYMHREIFLQSPSEFREDTRRALQAIEDALGSRVVGYRAPSFSITKGSLWALDVLLELGFAYDSSIFPTVHPAYGIPDACPYPSAMQRAGGTIWELPPATVHFAGRRWPIAGGAYLRHLPFSWTLRGLRRLTVRERIPAVLYLHTWEIDPGQPRLNVGPLARLRHYRNLGEVEQRLKNVLAGFRFRTVSSLLADLTAAREPSARRVRGMNGSGPT